MIRPGTKPVGAGLACAGSGGSEPPFAVTQGVVLVVFVALALAAAFKFRPAAAAA